MVDPSFFSFLRDLHTDKQLNDAARHIFPETDKKIAEVSKKNHDI